MIRKFYDYGGLDPIGGGEPFSIADYNKRCAEFLGYVNTTPTDKAYDHHSNHLRGVPV